MQGDVQFVQMPNGVAAVVSQDSVMQAIGVTLVPLLLTAFRINVKLDIFAPQELFYQFVALKVNTQQQLERR